MLLIDSRNYVTFCNTHATVMFQQGVHSKVVQELLGHQKVNTTLDIHTHYIPSLLFVNPFAANTLVLFG